MELLQLRYFKKVTECGSITRAAEQLHITQPSLSKTIKRLEQELNVKLFDRVGKNLHLNHNGEIFLKYAARALQALDDAQKELNDQNIYTYSTLTVYVQVASSLITKLVRDFNKLYPNISFKLTKRQYEQNRSDTVKYDFIIESTPSANSKNSITLLTEELLIACSSDHPFSRRESIALTEAANEPFISFSKQAALRAVTEHYCAETGFELRPVIECVDWATLCELVRLGMGIAFLPKHSWELDDTSGISFARISSPHCTRSITMSWGETEYLPQAARLFLEYTISRFKEFESN